MKARAVDAPRSAGARYEDIACAWLERAGLVLLARNFNCRYGELDLIMRDGDVIAFVEVRYRRGGSFGDGIDSIGASKRARLVRAASMFLAEQPRLSRHACRFDVIAVAGTPTAPTLDWRRDAFDAS